MTRVIKKYKIYFGLMLACCPVCFISTRIILKNPIYFAKIIPVSEKDVLNRPPLKDMSAYLHGKEVSYKLPVLLKEETLSEVKPFIGNSKKDFDRIIGINLWVREKLKFGDNFRHYFFWTPEEVIRDAENGHTFFCDAYARLAAAAAQSIGICARVFWLDGHVVPSFYVSEMRKWVMIDPTMGAYFKSGNTPLSVLEIIDCYKNGTPPQAVFFAEEKRADEMLESSTGIYTNAFTFLFDGESTEKGIRHLLFRERKIPVYVQYVEEQSKNFYLRRNVLWASEIISVLFILSMIVFFIHVLKTYPPPGGWF